MTNNLKTSEPTAHELAICSAFLEAGWTFQAQMVGDGSDNGQWHRVFRLSFATGGTQNIVVTAYTTTVLFVAVSNLEAPPNTIDFSAYQHIEGVPFVRLAIASDFPAVYVAMPVNAVLGSNVVAPAVSLLSEAVARLVAQIPGVVPSQSDRILFLK